MCTVNKTSCLLLSLWPYAEQTIVLHKYQAIDNGTVALDPNYMHQSGETLGELVLITFLQDIITHIRYAKKRKRKSLLSVISPNVHLSNNAFNCILVFNKATNKIIARSNSRLTLTNVFILYTASQSTLPFPYTIYISAYPA